MKLILRSDVEGVGHKGDVVEVSNGYGRNFLLPRGLAFKATDGAKAQADAMKRSRDIRDAAARQAAQEVAKQLVASPVSITARVGGDGRLFGSITTADVAAARLWVPTWCRPSCMQTWSSPSPSRLSPTSSFRPRGR